MNTNSQYIEKFSGQFSKEDAGVSILINETINNIRDMDAAGVYSYLLARPQNWIINPKHLMSHFECGKDKIYNVLNKLIKLGLLSVIKKRESGRFVESHYILHLKPITRINIEDSPRPEKPDTVKPDPVNPDTYKTKNIINKESNIKPFVDSSKSTEYDDDELFMSWYKTYPNKQKPRLTHKAFYKAFKKSKLTIEEFVSLLTTDVRKRVENNWKNRQKDKIPHPSTYLNNAEWQGEIYETAKNVKEFNKPASIKFSSMIKGMKK